MWTANLGLISTQPEHVRSTLLPYLTSRPANTIAIATLLLDCIKARQESALMRKTIATIYYREALA